MRPMETYHFIKGIWNEEVSAGTLVAIIAGLLLTHPQYQILLFEATRLIMCYFRLGMVSDSCGMLLFENQ